MNRRGKKVIKKQSRPPAALTELEREDVESEWSKTFMNLEKRLQKSDKQSWIQLCKKFVDENFDMLKDFNFTTDLSHGTTNESDFVKYSRILRYVSKDDLFDYLNIFLDCWDLKESYRRITDLMMFDGNPAPRFDQWPYKLPSKEEHEGFISLLEQTNNDSQIYNLFRMNNYDVDLIRQLMDLPQKSNMSADSGLLDEEFQQICLAFEPAERQGVMEIYQANGRNIELTCQHLNIRRCSKPPRRNKNSPIQITQKFVRPKTSLIWPDHAIQEPAEILLQIQAHPRIIDLHYYSCAEATEAVSTFINFHQGKRTFGELTIITGKGNNSETKAILRDHVKHLLKNMNITFKINPDNTGQILFRLKFR